MNEQILKPLTYVCKLVSERTLTQNHFHQADTSNWKFPSLQTQKLSSTKTSINKIHNKKYTHTTFTNTYCNLRNMGFRCQGKSKPLQNFGNLAIKGKNTLK